MTEPLLAVRGVKSFYGNIMALKGVAVDVHEGEIVTLIGANGAGKSTTLRSIQGINRPKRGKIKFKGDDIVGRRPHDIVKLGISQSPEGRRLFSRMSVRENLEIGSYAADFCVADFLLNRFNGAIDSTLSTASNNNGRSFPGQGASNRKADTRRRASDQCALSR
jgi:branched-chain amino acid transport system ATP-binding protein